MLKVKVLEKIFGKCVELLDSFNVYLRSVILKGFFILRTNTWLAVFPLRVESNY